MSTKPSPHEPGTSIGDATQGGGPSKPDSQRGAGQQVSRERGVATRSKKNPGKRPRQGGGSR